MIYPNHRVEIEELVLPEGTFLVKEILPSPGEVVKSDNPFVVPNSTHLNSIANAFYQNIGTDMAEVVRYGPTVSERGCLFSDCSRVLLKPGTITGSPTICNMSGETFVFVDSSDILAGY